MHITFYTYHQPMEHHRDLHCIYLVFNSPCLLPSLGVCPIRDKNRLLLQCLSMDQDQTTNLYRRPSIDASYQAVSEDFLKSVNQKQELPVVAIFVNELGQKCAIFSEDLP